MDKSAIFNILESYRNKTEPELKITVFQCLPKGEKMEEMIKRGVQFGAFEIVPVLSNLPFDNIATLSHKFSISSK